MSIGGLNSFSTPKMDQYKALQAKGPETEQLETQLTSVTAEKTTAQTSLETAKQTQATCNQNVSSAQSEVAAADSAVSAANSAMASAKRVPIRKYTNKEGKEVVDTSARDAAISAAVQQQITANAQKKEADRKLEEANNALREANDQVTNLTNQVTQLTQDETRITGEIEIKKSQYEAELAAAKTVADQEAQDIEKAKQEHENAIKNSVNTVLSGINPDDAAGVDRAALEAHLQTMFDGRTDVSESEMAAAANSYLQQQQAQSAESTEEVGGENPDGVSVEGAEAGEEGEGSEAGAEEQTPEEKITAEVEKAATTALESAEFVLEDGTAVELTDDQKTEIIQTLNSVYVAIENVDENIVSSLANSMVQTQLAKNQEAATAQEQTATAPEETFTGQEPAEVVVSTVDEAMATTETPEGSEEIALTQDQQVEIVQTLNDVFSKTENLDPSIIKYLAQGMVETAVAKNQEALTEEGTDVPEETYEPRFTDVEQVKEMIAETEEYIPTLNLSIYGEQIYGAQGILANLESNPEEALRLANEFDRELQQKSQQYQETVSAVIDYCSENGIDVDEFTMEDILSTNEEYIEPNHWVNTIRGSMGIDVSLVETELQLGINISSTINEDGDNVVSISNTDEKTGNVKESSYTYSDSKLTEVVTKDGDKQVTTSYQYNDDGSFVVTTNDGEKTTSLTSEEYVLNKLGVHGDSLDEDVVGNSNLSQAIQNCETYEDAFSYLTDFCEGDTTTARKIFNLIYSSSSVEEASVRDESTVTTASSVTKTYMNDSNELVTETTTSFTTLSIEEWEELNGVKVEDVTSFNEEEFARIEESALQDGQEVSGDETKQPSVKTVPVDMSKPQPYNGANESDITDKLFDFRNGHRILKNEVLQAFSSAGQQEGSSLVGAYEYYINAENELCKYEYSVTTDSTTGDTVIKAKTTIAATDEVVCEDVQTFTWDSELQDMTVSITRDGKEIAKDETMAQYYQRMLVERNYCSNGESLTSDEIEIRYHAMYSQDQAFGSAISDYASERNTQGFFDNIYNSLCKAFPGLGMTREDIEAEIKARTHMTDVLTMFTSGNVDGALSETNAEFVRRINEAESVDDVYEMAKNYYGEDLALEFMNELVNQEAFVDKLYYNGFSCGYEELMFEYSFVPAQGEESSQILITANQDAYGQPVSFELQVSTEIYTGADLADGLDVVMEKMSSSSPTDFDSLYKFWTDGGEITDATIKAYDEVNQLYTVFNSGIMASYQMEQSLADCYTPQDAMDVFLNACGQDQAQATIMFNNYYANVLSYVDVEWGVFSLNSVEAFIDDSGNIDYNVSYQDGYSDEPTTVIYGQMDPAEPDFTTINNMFSEVNYIVADEAVLQEQFVKNFQEQNPEIVERIFVENSAAYEELKGLSPDDKKYIFDEDGKIKTEKFIEFMNQSYDSVYTDLYGENKLQDIITDYEVQMDTYAAKLTSMVQMGSIGLSFVCPAFGFVAMGAGFIDNTIDLVNMASNDQKDNYTEWLKQTGFELFCTGAGMALGAVASKAGDIAYLKAAATRMSKGCAKTIGMGAEAITDFTTDMLFTFITTGDTDIVGSSSGVFLGVLGGIRGYGAGKNTCDFRTLRVGTDGYPTVKNMFGEDLRISNATKLPDGRYELELVDGRPFVTEMPDNLAADINLQAQSAAELGRSRNNATTEPQGVATTAVSAGEGADLGARTLEVEQGAGNTGEQMQASNSEDALETAPSMPSESATEMADVPQTTVITSSAEQTDVADAQVGAQTDLSVEKAQINLTTAEHKLYEAEAALAKAQASGSSAEILEAEINVDKAKQDFNDAMTKLGEPEATESQRAPEGGAEQTADQPADGQANPEGGAEQTAEQPADGQANPEGGAEQTAEQPADGQANPEGGAEQTADQPADGQAKPEGGAEQTADQPADGQSNPEGGAEQTADQPADGQAKPEGGAEQTADQPADGQANPEGGAEQTADQPADGQANPEGGAEQLDGQSPDGKTAPENGAGDLNPVTEAVDPQKTYNVDELGSKHYSELTPDEAKFLLENRTEPQKPSELDSDFDDDLSSGSRHDFEDEPDSGLSSGSRSYLEDESDSGFGFVSEEQAKLNEQYKREKRAYDLETARLKEIAGEPLNSTDYTALIRDKYDQIRSHNDYAVDYEQNFTSSQAELRSVLGFSDEMGATWNYPIGEAKADVEIKTRMSLNVMGSAEMVADLKTFMTTGRYTDSNGNIVQLDVETPLGVFKTSNTADWANREDPITMYYYGEVDSQVTKAIETITADYKRGNLTGADSHYIVEVSPSQEMVESLMSEISQYDPALSSAIYGMTYDLNTGMYIGTSSGQIRAVEELIAIYHPDQVKPSLVEYDVPQGKSPTVYKQGEPYKLTPVDRASNIIGNEVIKVQAPNGDIELDLLSMSSTLEEIPVDRIIRFGNGEYADIPMDGMPKDTYIEVAKTNTGEYIIINNSYMQVEVTPRMAVVEEPEIKLGTTDADVSDVDGVDGVKIAEETPNADDVKVADDAQGGNDADADDAKVADDAQGGNDADADEADVADDAQGGNDADADEADVADDAQGGNDADADEADVADDAQGGNDAEAGEVEPEFWTIEQQGQYAKLVASGIDESVAKQITSSNVTDSQIKLVTDLKKMGVSDEFIAKTYSAEHVDVDSLVKQRIEEATARLSSGERLSTNDIYALKEDIYNILRGRSETFADANKLTDVQSAKVKEYLDDFMDKAGFLPKYWISYGSVDPVSRISLNVVPTKDFIDELHLFKTTGQYVDSNGNLIQFPKDQMVDFAFKQPSSLEGVLNREDPVTMYFSDDIPQEMYNVIADITAKHARGPLYGAENSSTPWMKAEKYATGDQVKQLSAMLESEFPEMSAFLSGYTRNGMSTGEFRALESIVRETNPELLPSSSLLEIDMDYTGKFGSSIKPDPSTARTSIGTRLNSKAQALLSNLQGKLTSAYSYFGNLKVTISDKIHTMVVDKQYSSMRPDFQDTLAGFNLTTQQKAQVVDLYNKLDDLGIPKVDNPDGCVLNNAVDAKTFAGMVKSSVLTDAAGVDIETSFGSFPRSFVNDLSSDWVEKGFSVESIISDTRLTDNQRTAVANFYNKLADMGYKDFIDSNPDVFASMIQGSYGEYSVRYDKMAPNEMAVIVDSVQRFNNGEFSPEVLNAVDARVSDSINYRLFDYVGNLDAIPKDGIPMGFGDYKHSRENCIDWYNNQIVPLANCLNAESTVAPLNLVRRDNFTVFDKMEINGQKLSDLMQSKDPAVINQILDMFNAGDQSLTYNNFIGTSLADSATHEVRSDVLWNIQLPEGSNALYLEGLLKDGAIYSEGEVLLQMGTEFEINSARYENGSWIFDVVAKTSAQDVPPYDMHPYKGSEVYTDKPAGTKLPKNEGVVLTGKETLQLATSCQLDLSSPDIQTKLNALQDGESLVIGRNGDIQVGDQYVSSKHMTIEKSGDMFIVTDHSMNGTKILEPASSKANVPLENDIPAQVQAGNIPNRGENVVLDSSAYDPTHEFGRSVFDETTGKWITWDKTLEQFVVDPNQPPTSYVGKPVGTELPKEVPAIMKGTESLTLGSQYEFDMSSPEVQAKLARMKDGDIITVGRHGDIKVPDKYGKVSREHLQIQKFGDEYIITDVSSNGTKIARASEVDFADPKLNGDYHSSVDFDDDLGPELKPKSISTMQVGSKLPSFQPVEITGTESFKFASGQVVDLHSDEIWGHILDMQEDDIITIGGSKSSIKIPGAADTDSLMIQKKGKRYVLVDFSKNPVSISSMSSIPDAKPKNLQPTTSRPELDKYVAHSAGGTGSNPLSSSYHDVGHWWANPNQETSSQHSAWKIHVDSKTLGDYEALADVIVPYLMDHGITHKTFASGISPEMLTGKQSGKAFTIYPTSVEQAKQIMADLDYIIRNNDLAIESTGISGDRAIGDTGRLYYRYEFTSGSMKDATLNLANRQDVNVYHSNYRANDGSYLASDMTTADDPFYNFDPANPSGNVAAPNMRLNVEGPQSSIPKATLYTDKPVGTKLPKNVGVALTGTETLLLANSFEVDLSSPEIQQRLQSLEQGETLTIGRKGDIKVGDQYVSGTHIEVQKAGDMYIITDRSMNGTKIQKQATDSADVPSIETGKVGNEQVKTPNADDPEAVKVGDEQVKAPNADDPEAVKVGDEQVKAPNADDPETVKVEDEQVVSETDEPIDGATKVPDENTAEPKVDVASSQVGNIEEEVVQSLKNSDINAAFSKLRKSNLSTKDAMAKINEMLVNDLNVEPEKAKEMLGQYTFDCLDKNFPYDLGKSYDLIVNDPYLTQAQKDILVNKITLKAEAREAYTFGDVDEFNAKLKELGMTEADFKTQLFEGYTKSDSVVKEFVQNDDMAKRFLQLQHNGYSLQQCFEYCTDPVKCEQAILFKEKGIANQQELAYLLAKGNELAAERAQNIFNYAAQFKDAKGRPREVSLFYTNNLGNLNDVQYQKVLDLVAQGYDRLDIIQYSTDSNTQVLTARKYDKNGRITQEYEYIDAESSRTTRRTYLSNGLLKVETIGASGVYTESANKIVYIRGAQSADGSKSYVGDRYYSSGERIEVITDSNGNPVKAVEYKLIKGAPVMSEITEYPISSNDLVNGLDSFVDGIYKGTNKNGVALTTKEVKNGVTTYKETITNNGFTTTRTYSTDGSYSYVITDASGREILKSSRSYTRIDANTSQTILDGKVYTCSFDDSSKLITITDEAGNSRVIDINSKLQAYMAAQERGQYWGNFEQDKTKAAEAFWSSCKEMSADILTDFDEYINSVYIFDAKGRSCFYPENGSVFLNLKKESGPLYLFSHEFGHAIDSANSIKGNPELMEIFNKESDLLRNQNPSLYEEMIKYYSRPGGQRSEGLFWGDDGLEELIAEANAIVNGNLISNNDSILIQFFPETIAKVKELSPSLLSQMGDVQPDVQPDIQPDVKVNDVLDGVAKTPDIDVDPQVDVAAKVRQEQVQSLAQQYDGTDKSVSTLRQELESLGLSDTEVAEQISDYAVQYQKEKAMMPIDQNRDFLFSDSYDMFITMWTSDPNLTEAGKAKIETYVQDIIRKNEISAFGDAYKGADYDFDATISGIKNSKFLTPEEQTQLIDLCTQKHEKNLAYVEQGYSNAMAAELVCNPEKADLAASLSDKGVTAFNVERILQYTPEQLAKVEQLLQYENVEYTFIRNAKDLSESQIAQIAKYAEEGYGRFEIASIQTAEGQAIFSAMKMGVSESGNEIITQVSLDPQGNVIKTSYRENLPNGLTKSWDEGSNKVTYIQDYQYLGNQNNAIDVYLGTDGKPVEVIQTHPSQDLPSMAEVVKYTDFDSSLSVDDVAKLVLSGEMQGEPITHIQSDGQGNIDFSESYTNNGQTIERTFAQKADETGRVVSSEYTYRITTEDGSPVLSTTRTFEAIDENTTVTVVDGKKYTCSFDAETKSVTITQEGGMLQVIQFVDKATYKPGEIKISYSGVSEADIPKCEAEFMEYCKSLPADVLMTMKDTVSEVQLLPNEIESSYNQDLKRLRIGVGDSPFIISHELGHARDAQLNLANNESIVSAYNKEWEAFMADNSPAAQDIASYFSQIKGGGDHNFGINEMIAEVNAMLTTPNSNSDISVRSNILARYFPETVASIAKELGYEVDFSASQIDVDKALFAAEPQPHTVQSQNQVYDGLNLFGPFMAEKVDTTHSFSQLEYDPSSKKYKLYDETTGEWVSDDLAKIAYENVYGKDKASQLDAEYHDAVVIQPDTIEQKNQVYDGLNLFGPFRAEDIDITHNFSQLEYDPSTKEYKLYDETTGEWVSDDLAKIAYENVYGKDRASQLDALHEGVSEASSTPKPGMEQIEIPFTVGLDEVVAPEIPRTREVASFESDLPPVGFDAVKPESEIRTLASMVALGEIKTYQQAIDAGYTMADLYVSGTALDLIPQTDSVHLAEYFELKMYDQMGIKTPQDIDKMAQAIVSKTNCSYDDALAQISRYTQFSSFSQVEHLGSALRDLGIEFLVDTDCGTSINTAMNYLVKKSTTSLSVDPGVKGLILDEAGLDLLRNHRITGYDAKTGTLTIDLPSKDPLFEGLEPPIMESVSIKLLSVDGWSTKVGDKYYTNSLLGSSFATEDELVDFIAQTMTDGSTTIADEALAIIRSQLGETVSLEGCVSTIKNDSILSNPTPESIAKTMKPVMSREYTQAFFEVLPDGLFKKPETVTPETKHQVMSSVIRYLDSTATYLSPEKTSQMLRTMYSSGDASRPGITEYIDGLKAKGTLSADFTMDDVIYVVPEASSSFSIVTQQFMIANGINTSQVIAWDGQGAVPNGIDLNGKAVVILDDIVGSGKSMLSQKFKFWGENSDSGNAIVVDTSTNQPLFAKQYENVPVIVAPLSTLKQGETNILEAFRSTGHEGTVIAGTTVDVSAELVNDTFLQMAIGNTGYENGYAATFTPYMFPDNNTALASLFNYMSILNPNTSSIKSSGGVGEYLKLFYGKHISNPSPNSLCGKILAKMKENATRKK